METSTQPAANDAESMRHFYEVNYQRAWAVPGVIADDSFMYGQVLMALRPYIRPGMRVLDLGCNDGVLSLYLASKGCQVVGVDLARNAIDLARTAAARSNLANIE